MWYSEYFNCDCHNVLFNIPRKKSSNCLQFLVLICNHLVFQEQRCYEDKYSLQEIVSLSGNIYFRMRTSCLPKQEQTLFIVCLFCFVLRKKFTASRNILMTTSHWVTMHHVYWETHLHIWGKMEKGKWEEKVFFFLLTNHVCYDGLSKSD